MTTTARIPKKRSPNLAAERASLRPVKEVSRSCLRCQTPFMAESRVIRLCVNCRERG